MRQLNFRTTATAQANGTPQQCVHHRQPFNYFCETCEEPICHLCTTLGPHNFKLHRCNKLQDAFKQRVYRLQEEIKTNLLPKRENMLAQIHRIEYRIEEINYVASIIERDARAEMGGITDRLRTSETSKQAILQHESQEIQKDLNEMNDLGIEFHDLTTTHDQIGFLLHNQYLHERIEFLIAKPVKQGVDVVAQDLPQELTDLRLEIGKVEAQKLTLAALDEIIWMLLHERKQESDTMLGQLELEGKAEVKEWVKLVDHFTQQLKDQQMVCNFCARTLDAKTVNKKCKANMNVPQDPKIGFTREKPSDQNLGNGRHFWGHPVEELGLKEMVTSANTLPNAVLINSIMSKIKHRQVEHGVDLQKILMEHATNGYVNHIHFAFVMSDAVYLSQEEIDSLVTFIDDEKSGMIAVSDLFTYMQSSKRIKERADDLTSKYKPKKIKHLKK